MNWLKTLRTRFRALFRKRDLDREMDAEMRSHIEMRTQANIEAGMNPEAARFAALRQFGWAETIKEDCRDQRSSWAARQGTLLLQDFRFALRQLRKNPGFTAVAVLTLALCVGTNLAIFAVVEAVLLRPLPGLEPDRLVTLYNSFPKAGRDRLDSSQLNYTSRRGEIAAFSHLAALQHGTVVAGEPGATESIEMTRVSSTFFATLGVAPALGRVFAEAEMTPGADAVAILTDRYWRTHFAADPAVLGRSVRINGQAFVVIGVLPASYSYLSSRARLYLPLTLDPDAERIERWLNSSVELIARLKPGATLDEARVQLDAHNAMMLRGFPQAKEVTEAGFRSEVAPLRADHVASSRPALWLLQAGALFLLLMGCVNLVNLLLVRASGRAKELGVRSALGASRARIIGQTVLETEVLTCLGGIGGLVVGAAGIRWMSVMGIEQLPLIARVTFDVPHAVVAMTGAMAIGILIAFPISCWNARHWLAGALHSEGRGGTDQPAAQRLRHGFIVAQIALAFVLVTGASLLGLSLHRALQVPLGFRPEEVIAGRLSLPAQSHSPENRAAFADALLAELASLPGVAAAGIINDVPVNGVRDNNAMTIIGYESPAGTPPLLHPRYGVSGDYFAAMRIPLREGRYLESADSQRAARVCVVDENFARHYWPRGDALGQRLFEGPTARPIDQAFTVVGVVGNVRQSSPTAPQDPGAIYFPYTHLASSRLFMVARGPIRPEALATSLRAAVRRVDSDLPVEEIRSMESRVADSLVMLRSPAWITGLFAVVALLLAALGTYGVLSYAVARRTREIGLRKALGALPAQIHAQFLGIGTRLLVYGLAAGILTALAALRALRGLLFGVPHLHLGTLAAAALTLAATALLACWLPARRAARVDPMVALRTE